MTRYLNDAVTVTAQFTQASTGAALDPTGTPNYRVYEDNSDTPVLTGDLARMDDANTVGWYTAQFTASAANGFEVGKTYFVRTTATVDSIAQAGITNGGVFVIRENTTASAVASAVWAYADPGDAAGRATNLGGMLRQIWSYCFNRNRIAGSLQTIYRDDSATVMLQGAQSTSDTAADRGKMA